MAGLTALVDQLVALDDADIPAGTVERQKDLLIDTLGVAAAGRRAPGVAELVDFLREVGGREESRLWVFGGKLPAFHAAMANSLMAHAMDFDDMHEKAGIHANVCVVPAALALAERVGGISGKRLLTALVLGVDLACRMGVAIPLNRGWHATTTFGIFGAAAAAARILGLNGTQTANALGIAYSQASGNRQGRVEKTLTKRLQPALAVKAGVLSALLAARGMTGPRDILTGEWGMLRLYTGNGEPEDDDGIVTRLTRRLGEEFYGDELSIKPFPCCKAAHTAITGALRLLREEPITADRIEAVEVYVSKGCYQTVGRPFEIGKDPQVDAQFSIPYTVATALQEGKVGLEDFSEARIRDPLRMHLARKVQVQIDPALVEPSSNVVNLSSRVVVRVGGKAYARQTPMAKGHPGLPMDRSEIVAKFEDCLKFGSPELFTRRREMLELLMNLEKVKDIGDLTALFDRT